MVDRILRVPTSYNIINCSIENLPDGGVERWYSLAPVCKFLTKNEDGASLASLLLLQQDRVFKETWPAYCIPPRTQNPTPHLGLKSPSCLFLGYQCHHRATGSSHALARPIVSRLIMCSSSVLRFLLFWYMLEHIDEILRSARLSGYLFIRTVLFFFPSWAALLGEPLPIDDAEVDDWLPRFIVLHGSCIYLYMIATDLSPQDSTLLSSLKSKDSTLIKKQLTCVAFWKPTKCDYSETNHFISVGCNKIRNNVDSWLAALKIDCKLTSDSEDLNDPVKA
ncbi:hypothetical protein BUALT_Bualt15G0102700 [Buddleja alternifolia]|uniref:Uncharacterized protein n=1 Tax=Buddleja alternifolia TaxID=168488 RepID=A0AAV6WCG6_9LAMI|nr:hypothetical protein BUALT_Bualt15G0102700 [Buddleja alternifolia]